MNKAIATILKTSIGTIPVIDKVAGMVQVWEYQDTSYDETGLIKTTIIKRIPVSSDIDLSNCDPKDRTDLVPDSSKKGILYFEDGGVVTTGKDGPYFKYRSRLRLVCWLNRNFMTTTEPYAAPTLMNYLIAKMDKISGTKQGNFLKCLVLVDGIPKQDKALFSAYTYDQYNNGFLFEPYEYFAIDLSVEFQMHPGCFTVLLNQNAPACA